MRKRDLPSKQLLPHSSSHQQQEPDLHLQQQSSNLGSLEQDEARSLPQQNEQYTSNVGQQPISGSSSYQQSYLYPSQQSSNSGALEQDEARSLPQQQNQYYTSNVGQQPISGSSSYQQSYLHPSQQPPNLYRPPTDMFLQQPSSYSSQQSNQAWSPLPEQQNVIPGLYITGQQQGFHYQTHQQTNLHQQNFYANNPNPRYQFSHNLVSNQGQPYSHRVLDSDQQLISTSHLIPRLQQNTDSQLHQASYNQHRVWGQQSGSQTSQNLSNQSSNLVQQSTLRPQIRSFSQQQQQHSVSQQQEQCSFSQQQQERSFSQQQKTSVKYQRWPHQQKIQTQSHQDFEAKMDKQTQVVEQDNYKENILSMLSQLTLNQTSQETEITQKISSTMKYYQTCIPKRQDVNKAGTLGTPTSVLTNMFKIKFNKNFVTVAIHYDVDITSTISSKFPKALYRKVFEQCRKEHFINRHPAFDGTKNAYSAKDLPFGNRLETDVKIQDCKKQCHKTCDKHVKIFKIILNKVAAIDLNWIKKLQPGLEADRDQTSIQVLDIIMRHEPESQHINIGRSLFWNLEKDNGEDEKKIIIDLTGGLNLERGGFLSAVLGWQMYLNVDVVHKGFITPQKVDDLIIKLSSEMRTNIENKENYNKIAKFLKGVKVIYKMPQSSGLPHSKPRSRTYHLNGLGPNANEHKFSYEGSNITIKNYFANRYKYILRHPNLPCLSVGAQGKKTYLPAELCTIVAGQSVKKLNKTQTSKMITVAAENASKRRQRIKEAFKKINVNDSLTMKQEFRLSVDTEMQKVNARILKAPILKYDAAEVFVNKGKWYTRNNFVQPMNLGREEWSIINLDKSRKFAFHDMCAFMENLIRTANFVGMKIEKPDTNNFKSLDPENIEGIRNYFTYNKKLKLIIVVISNFPDTIYNKIKQITELELGVLTQCIKYQNIHEAKNTTIRNILLKINAKLNGINHTLHTIPKCFVNSCMLVGADVTHPSYDENTPSIAAVTASCDMFGFQYNVVLKLLQSKEEIISDLEKIIEIQLLIYQKKMSHLPERIIYYRDGVSEGQFSQVIHYEIQAIKRACATYKADIQITCLVVQKRHHVRFFPINDQSHNVEAGTIVDTEITHPSHIDFYLVSHESIKGTARPTKYRCIWNESNYTEDEIEELTYYLCHMYARCMKTVSYPAPTYYAHLAAYRGKVLIQGRNLDNLEEVQREFNKNMIHSPMYFV